MKKESNKQELSDTEKAHELASYAIDHYVKHHDVVLKKIEHARTATKQSLEECSESYENPESSQEVKDMKKYDKFWKELIELFKGAGMSIDGLQSIEDVLLKIPKMIKKYYDILLSQDKPLLKMIKELKSSKYKKAYKALKQMKATSNRISFNDIDNYRAQGAEYVLRRVSALPIQRS